MNEAVKPDTTLRPLVTPEGVPLNLHLANFGERATAVLLDLFIMGAILGTLVIAGTFLLSPAGYVVYSIFLMLLFFALRSFYFIFFEIRWHGMTPGKKIVGLRVIDRKGEALQPSAIFARNLMREVELWLPMTLFFFQAEIGVESGLLFLNTLWLGIFVFLPLFNKDNLRAGDLIGGTMVIRSPKITLLKDPVTQESLFKGTSFEDARTFTFTPDQLGVYGVYELQTLEKVLRTRGKEQENVFQSVADQIANKIQWSGEPYYTREEEFLSDFYAGLRQHHEGRLLFGKRKKDKFDSEGAPPKPKEKRPRVSPEPSSKIPQKPRKRRRR